MEMRPPLGFTWQPREIKRIHTSIRLRVAYSMQAKKSAARLISVAAMTATLVGGAAASANATSSSGTARFDNGQVILSIESSRQNSSTIRWTNNNGARGSYLSGSVCGGWGAVYVGADVAASAYYYGNYRVASAHV